MAYSRDTMLISRLSIAALPLASVALPHGSAASAQEVTSRPVVQALPSQEVEELRSALRALDRNPRSVDALLNAGYASVKVNDLEAAIGYFGRAEEVAPNDARVKQAQASVFMRGGRPVKALELFAQADAAGARDRSMMSDRGLAHDLVGDQTRAQAFYREALRDRPNDSEILRRMAVSQAIGGNKTAFTETLRPLVDQKDFAAFRAQAFGLAILGEQAQAKAVTEAVMSPDLARRIVPYLEYMPRLTKAQQAAAANLGIFPRAADIGREDPEIAQYARGATAEAATTALARDAGKGLEPAGEPLGPRPTVSQSTATAPVVARATPVPEPVARPITPPARAVVASAPQEQPQAPTQTEPRPVSGPGFDLGMAGNSAITGSDVPVQITPVGPSLPAVATRETLPAASPEPNFADAFADMGRADTRNVSKAADAVDIASFEAPREAKPEPKPVAKPKAPEHPQRFWVRLGTGQDAALFKWDWTRIARNAEGALEGLNGHYVPFGESFILLAGPVGSKNAMDELVGKLAEKGMGALPYTSSEGQEVQRLK